MTPPDFFAAIVGHAALKGTVVLLLALAFIGRLASARQRHFTWHLTFLALLALPLLAHLTPAYHPAIPEGTLRLMPQGLAAPPTSEPAKPTSGAVPSPAAAPDVVPRTAPLPLTDWLLWCWTIGALSVAVYYGYQYARILHFFRPTDTAVGDDRMEDLRALEDDLGLSRRVRILHSDRVDVPVVFGWRRPTVALPGDAWSWPADKRRQVLTHELIHLAQGDHLMQIVKQLANALYWFNPLVWKATRRSTLDRECACDDRVVATGIDPKAYAQTLLSTAQGLMASPRPLDAIPGMARPSELKVRIYSLLASAGGRGITRGWMVRTALLALVLTTGLAVLEPVIGAPRPVSTDPLSPQAGDDSVELLLQYVGGANTPPIDLLVDGEIALLGIGGGVGSYHTDGDRCYTLPPGEYTFAAQYTADQEVLAQNRVLMEDDRRYILFVIGRDDDMLIRVVDDELPPVEPGIQQVRFIHATIKEPSDVTLFQAAVARDGSYYSDKRLYVESAKPLGTISLVEIEAEPALHFSVDRDHEKPWYAGTYGRKISRTVVLMDSAYGSLGFILWPQFAVDLFSLQGVPADENLRSFIERYPQLVVTLRENPGLLGKLRAWVESSRH